VFCGLEIESGSRNELQQRLRGHRLCPILIKASTRFGCRLCASHPEDGGRIACGPGSNRHTSETIAVAGNQTLPGEDLINGIAAVGKETLPCRTSRHRFGRRPRSIQVGCCHGARGLRRVGPQIFFVHDIILVDDESHHARGPVQSGIGDGSESAA